MCRYWTCCFALLFAPLAPSRADSFDHYFNNTLALVPTSKNVQKVTQLTPQMMLDHARVLPNTTAAFLVVKTNDGRLSKLLVQPARQKIATGSVPILLIDRYVTYREGEDRAIHEQGKNIRLFQDSRLSLDLGQIVPKEVEADLRFVAEEDKVYLEPVGKAELYLVTKHFDEANPRNSPAPVIGEKFEPRFFSGSYRLYDDGRRMGLLKLSVGADGEVGGAYYTENGQKYEVSGKVGTPNHQIQFHVTFPRTVQFFTGYMFTGDGKAITGSSRMQEREAGFYAVRVEKE